MTARYSRTRFVPSGHLVPANMDMTTKLLEELTVKLMYFGNHTLDAITSEFWPEFSAAIRTVVFPPRDNTLAKRSVAALFASRVYLQVGRLAECLQYALAAGDMFNGPVCDEYVVAILSRCVDQYAKRDQSSTSSSDMRLETVVGCLLNKCLDDCDHRLLLCLGLRARRMDMITKCINLPLDDKNEMLSCAVLATMNYVDDSGFRKTVLSSLVSLLESQMTAPDHISLMRCYIFLGNPESACQLLQSLVQNNSENAIYLIAFDLYELASQRFLNCVLDSLKQTVLGMTTPIGLLIPETECDVDKLHCATETVAVVPYNVTTAQSDNKFNSIECGDKYSPETMRNLIKVLSGEISVEKNFQFLVQNNHADMSILNKTRKVIFTSICHTATLIANGFMHSGTANDKFLREYLEFTDWTTWDLFSAFVSLGVIHKGHEADSLQLIDSYLYLMRNNMSGSLGYSKGGGLYALGLIYANHGAAINDYLLRQLKNEHQEIVKHGGCLGIGLSAMGTGHKDIFDQLKTMMYHDSDVFGEAIGLGMGLVMLGSKNSEALQDLVVYAQLTQQEHILRGLAVGISFFMYNRLEEADLLITYLLQEKNPILRCSAMYTISMAYCGTGSKTAVKKLLLAANSDVNDDVRCAAVTSLGFLLFRIPEQCLQIISVLEKSYNPYVRYGAAMALGIAFAGTGHGEALYLLESMTTDFVNYVRQAAMIASALICIQQPESTCSKLKYFHTLYAKVIIDEKEDDVVKFGAILAQGIIDGGGGNVSISMDSRTGYLNTSTVVGLLLFTQYQHCICLAHCLSLAFTPICTIGFNTKLKISTYEMQSSNRIKHEICFSSLCKELAEKRGWIQYLFKNFKLKSKKQRGRLTKFETFAYRFLIPKIVRDVEIIKSNWQTGHFLLQRINCGSDYIQGVNCIQYDGNKIVSGLCDNTIKIWNKYTLECIKVLIGHTGSVMCLQYDDKMIISGSSDTTILVWNIITGEIVNELIFHNEAVLHLRFIGNILATCSKDSSIALWNILTPSEITLYRVLHGHLSEVNVVNFDNKYIVSGSKDCTIKVWNTLTCDFVRTLTGHYLGITCLHYKDRLVVSGSFDHTIRLWDIEYGACLRIIEDYDELTICIKFNSKIIVNGAYNGKIKVWDLEAALDPSIPECNLCLRTLKVHTDIVYELQFDEFQIISCSKDDTILVWDFLNYNTESNIVVDSANNTSIGGIS